LITDFRDARVVSDINSTLMAAANGARCDPDVPDDHTFEAEVTFAGSDVLSVRIIESWFCQAAYPNSADRSLVFDLRTGDIVHLQDLFRKDVPPERLYALLFPYELSRARPGAAPVASGDDDRECHEFWSLDEFADQGLNPGFHLTAEGIVVTPDFPHVFAACANAVTVPYSALGPIVVPDSPLARLGVTHTGKPMRYRIQRPAYPPEKDIFFTPPLE
jgi:hypothetical protein